MKVSEAPTVVEQTFDATLDKVWRSTTEPELMRRWYFDKISSFEPEVGFETKFTISNEGRDFPHRWKVTEVIPQKKIAYDWSYENYPGDSRVTFELLEAGTFTRLLLTHTVQEDFPEDVPEFQREGGLAGWQYFIQKSLKNHLEEKRT